MLLDSEKTVVKKINSSFFKIYPWIYGVLALLYISFAMHSPVTLYAHMVHDDAWFIGNAEKILAGQWLGAFDQMTLIKGLGYSYILVLNNLLDIPITLSLATIYLFACLFFVGVLREIGLGKIPALLLFCLLIFQPALFPGRIIRDNVYFSLLLISFSGLIYSSVCDPGRRRLVVIALSGLCFGVFWITREEGVWISPGFVAIFLYFMYKSAKKNGSCKSKVKAVFIYISFAAVPIISTACINYYIYGKLQIVDVKQADFVNVLNTLNSVDVGEDIQYVPVSKAKREAIYKASPAFKELEPYFEGTGMGWTDPGCKVYQHTCGDYAGGWFMWALRDGVASLGYYRTPMLAANFYRRIVEEVSTACSNGALKCKENPIPYMPRLTREAVNSIPSSFAKAVNLTIYKEPLPLTGGPSMGPPDRLESIRDFLGNPRVVQPPSFSGSGWYYAPREKWISLACNDADNRRSISIDRNPSPDIAAHFNDNGADRQRFSFKIDDFEKCELVFSGQEADNVKVVDLLKNSSKQMKVNDGLIYFENMHPSYSDRGFILDLKRLLFGIYGFFSFYLLVAGLLLTVATLFLSLCSKCRMGDLVVVSAALWVLYFSRILVVVMVDVTSFPAINNLYLLPAFPLWISASVIGISSFICMIHSMQKQKISHS